MAMKAYRGQENPQPNEEIARYGSRGRFSVLTAAQQRDIKQEVEKLGQVTILEYPTIGSEIVRPTTEFGKVGVTQGSGHYILFFINVNQGNSFSKIEIEAAKTKKDNNGDGPVYAYDETPEQAKKTATAAAVEKSNKQFAAHQKNVEKGYGQTLKDMSTTADPRNWAAKGFPGKDAHKHGSPAYSKMITNSTRLGTAIALYMPPSVQTTYQMKYSDVDAGMMAQALGGVMNWIGGQKVNITGGELTASMKKATLKALEGVAPGSKALLSIQSGSIISNKMELSFAGVERRSFNFTFNFTPKSPAEARVIDEIVTTFKFYSHPNFVEGTHGNSMTIPDTFDIRYMYQDKENHFINKISTCFCTNISVQYGGDRFTAHTPVPSFVGGNQNSPPPTKTVLTLTFKELEILTKPRIMQGF